MKYTVYIHALVAIWVMRNCRHHHLFFPSYISVWSRKVSKYNQRIIPRSVSILFSSIFSAQNIHLKKTHKHKTQQYLSLRMAAVWSRTFRDKPWHVNYYKCRNRKISDTKLNEKCELNLNFYDQVYYIYKENQTL